jgi:hypothetical protein
MREQEALARMVPPGQIRPRKEQMRGGVIQIMITRSCDLHCFHCTQGSNLSGKPAMMTPDQAEEAFVSLKDFWGVCGIFGGNPSVSPYFEEICARMRKWIPYERRGLWCNHPRGKGKVMAATFNPVVSNLNCHMSREAWDEFRRDWPQSRPFGLDTDSRHSPCYVAMKDVLKKQCSMCDGTGKGQTWVDDGDPCYYCDGTGQVYDESRAWELISGCDINQNWSALIGVFRGDLRAWFCEIAGAQAMLHEAESDYPDTGLDPTRLYDREWKTNPPNPQYLWWQLPMSAFAPQVRKHCHDCGVPLRGFGEMALAPDGVEQVSKTHEGVYKPKVRGRRVELVTVASQLGPRLNSTVDYVGNGRRPVDEIVRKGE